MREERKKTEKIINGQDVTDKCSVLALGTWCLEENPVNSTVHLDLNTT